MLKARFHPQGRRRSEFEIVGYIVWQTDDSLRPVFEPVRRVPESMLSKINYFIAITEPDSYAGLQALDSEFWSFVPATPDERPGER